MGSISPRRRAGLPLALLLLSLLLPGAPILPGGRSHPSSIHAQPSFARIHDIQSTAHRSPAEGRELDEIPGIVTLVISPSFTIQDPQPDSDPATSEGLLVHTDPSVHPIPTDLAPGDSVLVSGQVIEFRPTEDAADGLSSTTIEARQVQRLSQGNPLPAPIILGEAGRIPPSSNFDDDAFGDIELDGSFDAHTDGIDFYESLEHMRVQVDEALVVGPSHEGVIAVVGDAGRHATGLETQDGQPTGALTITPEDLNPERIFINPVAPLRLPRLHLGAHITTPIRGVLHYHDAIYQVQATNPFDHGDEEPVPTVVEPAGPTELLVATFNLKNLSIANSEPRFAPLADIIVHTLAAPDLLILQEIQDDNGPGNGGIVTATLTLAALTQAISSAGGPTYHPLSIDPRNNADGGAPSSNIRVVFLFRSDRGLTHANDIGPGDATTPVRIQVDATRAYSLTHSPGRIEPTNPVFAQSRKPLVAQFAWQGQPLFVVGLHLSSRLADTPVFGRHQPPILHSEPRRLEQARAVQAFASNLLAIDPNARLIIAGDLNDFPASPTLTTLASTTPLLSNLLGNRPYRPPESIPPLSRYTYNFQGNTQALDHILVSRSVASDTIMAEIPHIASHLASAAQTTDHDPVLARIDFRDESGGGNGTPEPPGSTHVYLPLVLGTWSLSGEHVTYTPSPVTATPTIEPSPVATTPSPSPSPSPTLLQPGPTPTPYPTVSSPPAITIIEMICDGGDEQVVLHASEDAPAAVSLAGWRLRSTIGDQSLLFSQEILDPGARLTIHSGPDAPEPSASHLLWTRRHVWTDGDVAQLLDPNAHLADEVPCP